jgi:TonB family protein
LIADEPTGNLDETTGRAIIDMMFDLPARRGATLALVTHDATLAARCDRVIRMRSGWIERYQRIACGRRSGPHFQLDDQDRSELEKAAANILESGDTDVVGLFRSHTREGFQLEEPDFGLISRYFSDPSDLILLIKPEGASDFLARFYVHEPGGGAQPVGEAFPFRGRLFIPGSQALRADIPREMDPGEVDTQEISEAAAPVVAERPRRLIPDFAPTAVEPMLFGTRESVPFEEPAEPSFGERLRKWLPLVAALLLVGIVLWLVLRPTRQQPPAAPVAATEPVRPLGLSVEPMGPDGKDWRVSWNASATALHDARSVQLFVRESDDQIRIDLTPDVLATGIYKYQPMGNDVTFRLEVVDNSGRISAESFRYVRNAASAAPPVPAPAPVKEAPAGGRARAKRTDPKVIHRVAPVIAAGIRPRIRNTVSIDVRVHVDERGRVTSAAPAVKPHQGLESYLAESAVQAARQWRFDPALENGKPVPGTQTIHFVFQK